MTHAARENERYRKSERAREQEKKKQQERERRIEHNERDIVLAFVFLSFALPGRAKERKTNTNSNEP